MTIARSLLLGAAATAMMAGSAYAADFVQPYVPDPVIEYIAPPCPFEGFYVGVFGGGIVNNDGYFLGDSHAAKIGGQVGVNFCPTDNIIAGVELSAAALFADADDHNYEVLGLGRLGFALNDVAMVYGALGGGVVAGEGAFAYGVGAEFLVTDNLGIDVRALGLSAHDGGHAAQGQIGLIWHIN